MWPTDYGSIYPYATDLSEYSFLERLATTNRPNVLCCTIVPFLPIILSDLQRNDGQL